MSLDDSERAGCHASRRGAGLGPRLSTPTTALRSGGRLRKRWMVKD